MVETQTTARAHAVSHRLNIYQALLAAIFLKGIKILAGGQLSSFHVMPINLSMLPLDFGVCLC